MWCWGLRSVVRSGVCVADLFLVDVVVVVCLNDCSWIFLAV